jgi:peptide chain release factor 3
VLGTIPARACRSRTCAREADEALVAQQFLARERSAIEEAWPGDVIGVMDRGTLRIGDTLAEQPGLEFSGIPRFAPEHFARIVAADPLKRKQLDAGLRQLTEEGAAQVFYTSGTDTLSPTPIVGAVGQLQFDVMLHRLEHEYGAPCRLERISARHPRWVVGPMDEIERIAATAAGCSSSTPRDIRCCCSRMRGDCDGCWNGRRRHVS